MHTPSSNPRIQRAAQAAVWPALLLFAAGLAFFAVTGTLSRYWADDYCYTATIQQMGLLRGLVDWYRHSGNRLSTLVVVAFSELFGPSAIRFVPAAVLALWVAACTLFLGRLRRRLAPKAASLAWIALLALVITYFAALLAPDRLQTVYWRMGTLHYSLPAPLLLLNLALLVAALGASRPRVWPALLSGLLAFFTAGLSETFAALQAGLFALAIAAAAIFARRERRAALLGLLAAPLLGTLLMMGLMMGAPANAWRQEVMPPPDNPLLILPYSLRFAAEFIFYAVRGAPVPFAAFFLVIFAAVLLGLDHRSTPLSPRRAAAGLLLAPLAAYLLIVCSFTPSAFAGLAYPAGRALMPGHFALLSGLAAAAFFAAMLAHALLARRHLPARFAPWIAALAALVLLLGSLYPLRALPALRQEAAQLEVRAARWDARAAQIRADLAAGQRQVLTRQTDVVQGLEDIGPNPNFWINRCAAVYFGASSITANP